MLLHFSLPITSADLSGMPELVVLWFELVMEKPGMKAERILMVAPHISINNLTDVKYIKYVLPENNHRFLFSRYEYVSGFSEAGL